MFAFCNLQWNIGTYGASTENPISSMFVCYYCKNCISNNVSLLFSSNEKKFVGFSNNITLVKIGSFK